MNRMINGEVVEVSASEASELQAEWDENADIQAATKYQQDRNYGTIGEQLDMIYWDRVNGTNLWEESIAAEKIRVPKP